MDIKEIEELNKKRTPDKWVGGSQKIWHENQIACIGECFAGIEGEAGNLEFIAAAPTLAEQYIKARRFEVTDKFIERLELDKDIRETVKQICQAVIDEMWKEIEAAHDQ